MTVTDNSGTRTHVYNYDAIYQLTDVNYPSSMSYRVFSAGLKNL
jgi:hypothetical protein